MYRYSLCSTLYMIPIEMQVGMTHVNKEPQIYLSTRLSTRGVSHAWIYCMWQSISALISHPVRLRRKVFLVGWLHAKMVFIHPSLHQYTNCWCMHQRYHKARLPPGLRESCTRSRGILVSKSQCKESNTHCR